MADAHTAMRLLSVGKALVAAAVQQPLLLVPTTTAQALLRRRPLSLAQFLPAVFLASQSLSPLDSDGCRSP